MSATDSTEPSPDAARGQHAPSLGAASRSSSSGHISVVRRRAARRPQGAASSNNSGAYVPGASGPPSARSATGATTLADEFQAAYAAAAAAGATGHGRPPVAASGPGGSSLSLDTPMSILSGAADADADADPPSASASHTPPPLVPLSSPPRHGGTFLRETDGLAVDDDEEDDAVRNDDDAVAVAEAAAALAAASDPAATASSSERLGRSSSGRSPEMTFGTLAISTLLDGDGEHEGALTLRSDDDDEAIAAGHSPSFGRRRIGGSRDRSRGAGSDLALSISGTSFALSQGLVTPSHSFASPSHALRGLTPISGNASISASAAASPMARQNSAQGSFGRHPSLGSSRARADSLRGIGMMSGTESEAGGDDTGVVEPSPSFEPVRLSRRTPTNAAALQRSGSQPLPQDPPHQPLRRSASPGASITSPQHVGQLPTANPPLLHCAPIARVPSLPTSASSSQLPALRSPPFAGRPRASTGPGQSPRLNPIATRAQLARLPLLVLDLDRTMILADTKAGLCAGDFIMDYRGLRLYVDFRPRLREFLRSAARNFRLAVFTAAEEGYARPIAQEIERWAGVEFVSVKCNHDCTRQAVSGPLPQRPFIESLPAASANATVSGSSTGSSGSRSGTSNTRCQLVKDLTAFGEPLDRVLLVDDKAVSFSSQTRNGVLIAPYRRPTPDDDELERVGRLLEHVAASQYRDVRLALEDAKAAMAEQAHQSRTAVGASVTPVAASAATPSHTSGAGNSLPANVSFDWGVFNALSGARAPGGYIPPAAATPLASTSSEGTPQAAALPTRASSVHANPLPPSRESATAAALSATGGQQQQQQLGRRRSWTSGATTRPLSLGVSGANSRSGADLAAARRQGGTATPTTNHLPSGGTAGGGRQRARAAYEDEWR